jgi:formate dehydrogenase major subunit
VPGLGISFGRGGATTFLQDLQNSDVILIQGSNMAECHPVGFQWVMEAKERGAKIIHVDPRFTRTSALADLHVPIRAGSDIAFLGGIIHYILENDKAFKEYVVSYTNAANLVDPDFRDTEDLDGFFSGWEADKGKYDDGSWQYQGVDEVAAAGHKEVVPEGHANKEGPRGTNTKEAPRDPTLQHPRCVYQLLRKHYARYTPANVAEICGVEVDRFLQVCELFTKSSGRERTGAICYAVGWTQHTVGAQNIRAASIIQALLGNIGRPGGGIMALRGHASIQGSTDIPTLFDLLPGYIPMVHAEMKKLRDFIDTNTAANGFWSEFPSYFVSLMKAWFGEAATKANDWAFDWLPRITSDHSHLTTMADMAEGKIKGYIVMGENPLVGSVNGGLQRQGLQKLDWLVVRDLALIETAQFWREAPGCETEVFFIPAAAHTEKDGSFTNTNRLLQWHHKAVEPPGDCKSDLDFVYELGNRLKALYADSNEPKDAPLRALTWNTPDAESVLAEINGKVIASGKPLSKYTELKADGSTASGCWIYVGCRADGVNQTARRKPAREQDWVAREWAWSWPDNRRMLYNRASADPEGRPWSERKRYVYWSGEKWVGSDQADFIADRAPSYRPPPGARGTAALAGDDPFIMQSDGKAWLFAPAGMLDGPMPTHYEPQESAVPNLLYAQHCNPARMEWHLRRNPYHRAYADPRYPYVITTFRLTEHHTGGGMSRWLSWLAELMPRLFCEVSPELAAERGLENGAWATISTARGELECRVLVTRRLRPLRLGKRTVHQIGIPYHWGSEGLVTGDAVNELVALVADPNVNIPENKALTGDIRPGRRQRGEHVRGELPEVADLRDLTGLKPYVQKAAQEKK